ncbi:unnamed protein product [Triticum turgidum subsp. durum]|uniref:Uncharacterized protein n=1 Tax=Triticum turgidum subsp. durum TaxID=4567 RepID=A0A9R0VXX8_TRITD|nr:unnamed protein product [Triticum turgidum subsp. durum]
MAAHEASAGGGEGARCTPPRPALSLPPRSAVESFFASGATAASFAETSPGPFTLAAALFPDMPSSAFHGSFTQLLAGAMGSPAAPPSPPSPFAVPPGLSPTALLGPPSLFSPTVTPPALLYLLLHQCLPLLRFPARALRVLVC